MKNSYKKIISVVLTIIILLTAAPMSGFVGLKLNLDWLNFDWLDFSTKSSALDATGQCGDNVYWNFDESTGTLTISGMGDMKNYSNYSSDLSPFNNNSSIKSILIESGVTSIGSFAFRGCTGLISITIPESVMLIGRHAFSGCTGLTSITIPDSVTSISDYVFYSCINLTSITIPDSVTSIGDFAFRNCTGLISVKIPDSVTSIGVSAFYDCTSLKSVIINSIEAWCNIYFPGNVSNPLFYAHNLYLNNELVTDLILPDSVTRIGGEAFYNCTSLISLTIPDSVTSIGYCAFYGCTGITCITIGNEVTSIGGSAFYGCTGLTNVTIPDSVTSIGSYTFYNCTGLTSVTIGNGLTSIASETFHGCTSLSSISIGSGVTSINKNAFSECTGITSVNINSISSWCNISFYDVVSNPLYYAHNLYVKGKAITNLIIPDGVTSIKKYAFYSCSDIASITIPDSVIYIDDNAFPPENSYSYDTHHIIYCCSNTFSSSYAVDKNHKYLLYYVPDGDNVNVSEVVTNKLSYTLNKETRTLTIDCNGVMPSFQSQDPPWSQYKNYIEHIIVNEGCTKISYNAFKDFYITDISLPSTVTEIETSAFEKCTRLSKVTIPDSVTNIGNNAFSGCLSLANLSLGANLVTIGDFSFQKCSSLAYLNIRYNVTSIGYCAFDGCKNISSITLGKRITSIGYYAFRNCTSLKTLNYNVINCNWNRYSSSPFDGCNNLETLNIATNVKSIPAYAFFGCEKLEEVILPESVENIGANSFANVKTIKIYNKNCTIGENAIPYNATIYGYAGSTAEAFANENGYNFEYLGEGHEHLYDNDCDTVCNICGFTRTVTHSYDSDCDDTCNICGARRTPNHHYAWVTVRNATTTEEGLAQKKCTVCGYVAEEFTIPVMVADFVTGITISPKTIALSAGETANITALITPETAANKNIIWSSTDSENAAVSDGTVTAVRPGTSVIIAETEDGGYRDFCQVRVISLTASNGAVVNSENGLVYGLAPKLGSIDGYIDTVDDSISAVCEDSVIGTGSVIQIVRDGELIDSYKAVIFGDVNSDGVYDGQDAFIVNCIANGMLTREQVGEAKFLAADCNHDGEVNSSDVLILEQAGLLLSKVEQAKDEEMKEQALGEYLDLIDQNPEINEADEATEEKTASIFDRIIDFVKKIIDFLKSILAKF